MTAARSRTLGAIHPCSVATALDGIAREHRHLPRCQGGLVAFEARNRAGWPVGWCLIGRPVSRVLQARGWVEVVRCATTGRCWGAASALYRAADAWARENRGGLVTYTLEHETGASLLAAGWVPIGWTQTRPSQWDRASRRRRRRADVIAAPKRRWAPPWAAELWACREDTP